MDGIGPGEHGSMKQDFKNRLTSNSEEWGTPKILFDQLNELFQFDWDAAASDWNTKVPRFFSKDDDALMQDWYGTVMDARGNQPGPNLPAVWLNPPYGRNMGAWIRKAYEESQRGMDVIVLIFCRSCTRWWHETVRNALSVTFLQGRVPFVRPDGSSKGAAPASSVILHFGPKSIDQYPKPERDRPLTSRPDLAFWNWRDGFGSLPDLAPERPYITWR